MRLILTHEQADLDALASLAAAKALDPAAWALIPRLINRNGRDFLKRYQADLGLSQLSDLPSEPIEHITLVDTQSLITLKGMHPHIPVVAIDHHPRRQAPNPDWDYDLHQTGACTTILVEKIRAAEVVIGPPLSTLLLLGIYEDTGSLSYASTTPRDAYAAAFLLENRADLNMVSRYLNPPLSHAQQSLYDRLMKDVTTHEISGRVILLARAIALDIQDEISTIAHKMRDSLGPDGLILQVATRQGIRLVARSTTDDVDVAMLARHFGGGGHKRAASALVHTGTASDAGALPPEWENVTGRILDMLPEIVQPATKVSEIMSPNPMVLDPNTPLAVISYHMQRYGFEGYPVVDEGKVVGLVNRRSVDRALAHKIPATAGSLMEAGSITVGPSSDLDEVRHQMALSGWGQIPVVDPASGEVIGIVTRTDLIHTHEKPLDLPKAQAIAEKMRSALSPAKLKLLEVFSKEAAIRELPTYLVGGFVRDLLLGRPSPDYDVVVEGDAIQFVRALVESFGGRAVAHARFGTAKWLIGEAREEVASKLDPTAVLDPLDLPDSVDLISARTEFYEKPAALPTVERSSIKMDLHRRDFTINTLALRLDQPFYAQLLDYWGGYADLQDGLVRVLHALSFVDDGTRILRAVRFSERFQFQIEARTLNLLQGSLDLLEQVSGTRLGHELDLILQEKAYLNMLDRLKELGILAAIHPDLPWDDDIRARLEHFDSNQPDGNGKDLRGARLSLWLEGLPDAALARVCKRLRYPRQVETDIHQTRALRALLPGLLALKPSKLVSVLEPFSEKVRRLVQASTTDAELGAVLERYEKTYQHVWPKADGKDLLGLGLKPSARFNDILTRLRDAWLDGEVNTPNEEKALLEGLVKEA